MKNQKHTATEWIAEDRLIDCSLTISAVSGVRICEVKSFNHKDFNDPTETEADANAALITAAPDLLHSAFFALCALEDIKEQSDMQKLALISIKESIKKATTIKKAAQ